MDTEKMYKIGNLILTDKREKNLHLISMKDGKKNKDRQTHKYRSQIDKKYTAFAIITL